MGIIRFAAAIGLAVLASNSAIADQTLPNGWGNGVQGTFIYAHKCAGCHSERDSKSAGTNLHTCWSDPTKMFSYIKETMPGNAPGSLKDAEVYGIVAYLLNVGQVIGRSDIMNARTLPTVAMSNPGVIPAWCPISAGGLGKFGALKDGRAMVPAPVPVAPAVVAAPAPVPSIIAKPKLTTPPSRPTPPIKLAPQKP